MFKVGEKIVCVDTVYINLNDFYNNPKKKSKLKSITNGGRYIVIDSTKRFTSVLDNRGVKRTYKTSRFKTPLEYRRIALYELLNRIKNEKN
jgi:hypothetical protein